MRPHALNAVCEIKCGIFPFTYAKTGRHNNVLIVLIELSVLYIKLGAARISRAALAFQADFVRADGRFTVPILLMNAEYV